MRSYMPLTTPIPLSVDVFSNSVSHPLTTSILDRAWIGPCAWTLSCIRGCDLLSRHWLICWLSFYASLRVYCSRSRFLCEKIYLIAAPIKLHCRILSCLSSFDIFRHCLVVDTIWSLSRNWALPCAKKACRGCTWLYLAIWCRIQKELGSGVWLGYKVWMAISTLVRRLHVSHQPPVSIIDSWLFIW